jgi:hypothetical protein
MSSPQSGTPAPGSHGPDPAEAPVVAKYQAMVSLDVEQAALVIVDKDLAERNRERFTDTPDFSSDPPPPVNASIEALLMRRLLSVMGFRSEIRASSSEQARAALAERWPDVETQRARVQQRGVANRFERIVAEGVIRADGTAEWGYTHGLANGDPLPISATANGGASELDRYVQGQLQIALLDDAGPLG